jgi:hypothetical protein
MSGAGAFVNTPASLPGLAFWVRSDLGVTLVQGPVVATGTSPPAVTFSGTPSSTSNSIVLTCTAAGTNTTATFSWTLNGVAQTPFTAAATVVLTGTGITATFPVGAYTNTPSADTYTSVVTVSAWADQSGNGHTASQATALQQFAYLPTGGPNGTAVMVGNNANNTLMTASIGTIAKPCWVWMVFKFNSGTLGDVLDGQTVSTLRTFNGGASTLLTVETPTNLSATVTSNQVYAAYGFTYGSSGSIYLNASLIASGTTGTNSSTGLTIGAAGNGSQSADCSISEIVITSAPPANNNVLSAYSQARYGFG